MMRFLGLLALSGVGLCSVSQAQDKIPAVVELKEKGIRFLKKGDVKAPIVTETTNFLIFSGMTEAKAKALGDYLEKVSTIASKGLKLEPRDDSKEAKMSLYLFPTIDGYSSYVRSELGRRPERDETYAMETRSKAPYLAIAPKVAGSNATFDTLVGDMLCGALLQRKAGNAALTEWMKDGFARAVQMRINSGVAGTDRGAVRRIAPPVPKTAKTHACVVDKAWSGTGKEKEQFAGCLMDYFVFGTGGMKFGAILSGLTPSDDNRMPTFDRALMTAEIKLEDLDRDWRDWLSKGSPAGK